MLKKLRQALADLKEEGRKAVARVKEIEAKEDRSESEEKELAALNARLDALDVEVKKADDNVKAEERRIDRERLFGDTVQTPAARTVTSTEPNPVRTNGFRDIAEFASAVKRATPGGGNVPTVDPRLAGPMAAPTNFHQELGSTDGYMVPTQFRDEIWELVTAGGDLLNLVNPEPTNSNTVGMLVDETTPWGATGVQAYWRGEGTQMTASRLATQERQLSLHQLYAFVTATDELLSDAPRLASRLTRGAARAITYKASDAIMWGDGVGKPMGFMNSAALVTQAKESGQAADTIVAANLGKMFSRLHTQNLAGVVWLANIDTFSQLIGLTIGDTPVFTPPNAGMQQAPGGFILGRPVHFTEHADTVGDVGDIVLVDPVGYYAATKAGEGIKFASSMHLYFDYGLEAFRWTFRLAGQPILSAAVTPARSANTRSHFVALAARA